MNTSSSSRSSALLLGMLLALSTTAAAQWSPGPSLSNPRQAPAVDRHGGDIYAVGGVSAPNTGGTSWITLAPLPTGQEGLAAAVVGDRIYTFGGFGYADTCQIYDIATNTWPAGPPVPVGLYWSTAEAVGTDIYPIAGCVPPNLFAVLLPLKPCRISDSRRDGMPMTGTSRRDPGRLSGFRDTPHSERPH